MDINKSSAVPPGLIACFCGFPLTEESMPETDFLLTEYRLFCFWVGKFEIPEKEK